MSDTWTDPRYTELVDEYDRLREKRATTVRHCPGCLHGLGSLMMVDLKTRRPLLVNCGLCGAPR
ncbi:hypothetical protein ACPCSE_30035 [Streptomyces cellulosae]